MRNWRLWLGIVLSAACLYLSVRGIDWLALRNNLGQIRWIWLVPASLCLMGTMVARALRWRLLLQPLERLTSQRLFHVLNVGYMLNNILPVRLGDIVRAYLCAEMEPMAVGRALSTVVVERVADVLAVLAILLLMLPSTELPNTVVVAARTAGVSALLAGVALLALGLGGRQAIVWMDRVVGRLPVPGKAWLMNQVHSGIAGLSALGSWGTLAQLLGWSMAIWLVAGLQFGACLPAVGLSLPIAAALMVLCVTSLGMVVPSSPGYIGVFEYLTVLVLGAFRVPAEVALVYAVVLHASMYLSVIALGLVGVAAEGLSYARLRLAVTARGPNGLTTQAS